jgi:hypothetical protein
MTNYDNISDKDMFWIWRVAFDRFLVTLEFKTYHNLSPKE